MDYVKQLAAAGLKNVSRLSRDFYSSAACEKVAQLLLGKRLVVHKQGVIRVGRIVETEAYLGPKDLAAHSSKGVTPRTQIMFGPSGFVYVYLIYGMHHCMNVVTGNGTAVLLRALEPVLNVDAPMHGPGRLCKAMGIDRSDYGADLCGEQIFLLDAPPIAEADIVVRPRVGVAYAGEWADAPLRFYIKDNKYISRA